MPVREGWNSSKGVVSLDQAEPTESSECHLAPDLLTWLHKGEMREVIQRTGQIIVGCVYS